MGDLLPTAADDERLVPVASLAGDDGLEDIGDLAVIVASLAEPLAGNPAVAAGLVPPQRRVLSPVGRDETGMRWYASEHGPKSPLAHAAPASLRELRVLRPAERPARLGVRRAARTRSPPTTAGSSRSTTAAARTPRRLLPGARISRCRR